MPIPPGATKLTRNDFLLLTPDSQEEFYIILINLTYPEPTIVWEGISRLTISLFVDQTKKFRGMRQVTFVLAVRDWAEYCVDERPGPHYNHDMVTDDGDCQAEDYFMQVYWLSGGGMSEAESTSEQEKQPMANNTAATASGAANNANNNAPVPAKVKSYEVAFFLARSARLGYNEAFNYWAGELYQAEQGLAAYLKRHNITDYNPTSPPAEQGWTHKVAQARDRLSQLEAVYEAAVDQLAATYHLEKEELLRINTDPGSF